MSTHCDCCGTHEIVSALKALHEELKKLNKALDAVTVESKGTSDGGRTWRSFGLALKVTDKLAE